jgi:hypothetical protein
MKAFTTCSSAALTLALVSLAPLPAAAATNLYDNISVSSGAIDRAASDGPLYDSFSTGSAAVDLSLILINLTNDGVTGSTGSFSVNLYADSSTSPGALLTTIATLPDSDLSTSIDSFALSPATPELLAADTRYWIGVVGPRSSVAWSVASDATGTGVAGEFWASTPGGSLTVIANSDANPPYQMLVSVAAASVPEPSTWAMLTLGFAGLGFAGYVSRPRPRPFSR